MSILKLFLVVFTVGLLGMEPDYEESLLIEATRRGDQAEVLKLLDAGENVDVRDEQWRTPLMIAAESQLLPLVELLLDRGAYVNAKDELGFSPLMYAAQVGSEPIVNLLLKHGADVSLKNDEEKTALEIAQKKEIVKVLKEWVHIAHMVIVYDHTAALSDDNYSMAENSAISQQLKGLIYAGSEPFLANGKIAQVILYFIQNPDDTVYKSVGLTLVRNAIKNNFKEDEWDLYVIYEPEPFVLFMPKKYLETHKQHGINLKKLQKFEKKDLSTVIEKLEAASEPASKAVQTILSLFQKYDPENPLEWNIILLGHGMTSIKYGRMAAALSLKGSGAFIAGFPSDQFIKLIEGWGNKIKLNVVLWFSCHGGGLNAESLQQIIKIIKTFKKDFNPGILISAALADESISATSRIAQFREIFHYLDLIRNGESIPASIMRNAAYAVNLLELDVFADGLIFIPEEGYFKLLQPEFKRGYVFDIFKIREEHRDEPIIIKYPRKAKIKLIAPGEMTEQTIKTIESSGDLADILGDSLFDANKKTAFFKIANINTITGKIDDGIFGKLPFKIEKESETLYDVKIIIFPESLACLGYVAFSIIDTYPRDIYVWKLLQDGDVISYIPVKIYTDIKNEKQYTQTLQKIQQQVLVDGLFERSFMSVCARTEKERFSSAFNLFERRFEQKKSSPFRELLLKYNIHSDVVPSNEGIQNILINIASAGSVGISSLMCLSKDEQKKILSEFKNLPETMLVLFKKEINQQDKKGDTALIVAVRKGDKDVVELLLDGGADANLQNEDGNTALMTAAMKGDKNIVQLLLDNGADANLQNKDNNAALHWAASKGYKDIVELLLDKGANVNLYNTNDTPLLIAAFKGDEDIVKLLLDRGADLNLKGKTGFTVLDVAKDAKIQDLIKQKKQKELDDQFFKAVEDNDKEAAEELLKQGADVNIQRNELTALMYVADNGNKDMVQLLLADPRIDVNIQNEYGDTSLIWAAAKGYEDIVALLLDKGADVSLRSNKELTALDYAQSNENPGVAALLEDFNLHGEKALDEYFKKEKSELKIERCEGDRPEEEWNKPSFDAIKQNDSEILNEFAKKGIDNCQDSFGGTILMYAAYIGNKNFLDYLIKNGARLDVKDTDGADALLYAVRSGAPDMVVALLQEATKLQENLDMKRALNYARERDQSHIVTLLEDYERRGEEALAPYVEMGKEPIIVPS